MIETVGFLAVCTMVVCYAFENRNRIFTLVFAGACAVAAVYAFLIGSYPFMIAEGIWAIIALRKWRNSVVDQEMPVSLKADTQANSL